jgi:hypothetical protein
MPYLVSAAGWSSSEDERALTIDAAWTVSGERDPREVYDAYQRAVDDGGEVLVKSHLWRRAETAAVDAVRQRRRRDNGRLEGS